MQADNSLQPPIQPMGIRRSLLVFGLPAVVFVLAFYLIMPYLVVNGIDPIVSYMVALLIPLILLTLASIQGYRREGRALTWVGIKERFRIKPMTGRDWLWTLGMLVVAFIGYGVLSQIGLALIRAGVVTVPDIVPAILNPAMQTTAQSPVELLGDVRGQWGLVVLNIVLLFFNIVGEEFWWRGYILPRQELAFGRFTWVLHGVLWCLFHVFKFWDLFGLLPVTLALSYLAQRRQNTTPVMVAHAVFNGLSIIGLALLVAGVI